MNDKEIMRVLLSAYIQYKESLLFTKYEPTFAGFMDFIERGLNLTNPTPKE